MAINGCFFVLASNSPTILSTEAYGDFDAANRAPGWSTWLTFAISPSEPTVAKPVKQMFTK